MTHTGIPFVAVAAMSARDGLPGRNFWMRDSADGFGYNIES